MKNLSIFSPDELMNLIEKRIGCEIFLDKLSEVSKHEAYNRALKHPQVNKCQRPGELVLDHSFCQHFKQQEHLVINHLTTNQVPFLVIFELHNYQIALLLNFLNSCQMAKRFLKVSSNGNKSFKYLVKRQQDF